MSLRSRGALAGVLALVVGSGCQSFVGDYKADLDTAQPVDSSGLCEIERNAFAFQVDFASDEQLPTLFDYYEERNPDFIAHIESVIADYQAGATGSEVTYLSGAAGVGKSFVLRGLDALADNEQCTVDLGELFVESPDELAFDVVSTPDLETLDGGIVFNELPTLKTPSEFTLDSLLQSAGCYVDDQLVPLVFIDGIDEVHDDTAKLILEAVDEFVIGHQDSGEFVHFLVAGRPEGFAPWLTDSDRDETSNEHLSRFELEPPRYDTAGDVEFRALGYWDFTMLLEELDANGERDAYLARVEDAVAKHPFLTYSLGNLAFGNAVVEHTGPGDEQGEEDLKVGLFDDILLRDVDTHNRPGTDSPYNGAYRRALEEVAARYADVNDKGIFTVRSEDTVPVTGENGEALGEVRVRTLLNHSGAAFLTAATTTTRYHFDPFWFQAHLIERYNQRHFPGYEYRGCE